MHQFGEHLSVMKRLDALVKRMDRDHEEFCELLTRLPANIEQPKPESHKGMDDQAERLIQTIETLEARSKGFENRVYDMATEKANIRKILLPLITLPCVASGLTGKRVANIRDLQKVARFLGLDLTIAQAKDIIDG